MPPRSVTALASGGAAMALSAAGMRLAGRSSVGRAEPAQAGWAAAAPTWWRLNYAQRRVTLVEGPVAVGSALGGLLVGRLLGRGPAADSATAVAMAGSAAVGLYDDVYGSSQAKGLAGHFRALRSGRVTSGMIKVAGVSASAFVAAWLIDAHQPSSRSRPVDLALNTTLIAGMANLVNLLDLRPGRAAKVVTVAGVALLGVGSAPLVGAATGVLPADLNESAMLGDCGANGLGAGIGVVVARTPRTVRAVVWSVVVLLTVISERVSFTAVIDSQPFLRHLDRLGRRRE